MYRSSKRRLRLAVRPFGIENLEDRALLAAAPFVADEILVKFKDGFGENDRASVRAAVHATHSESIETDAMRAAGYRGLELLKVPADVNVSGALVQLQRNPMVEYAEPNWIYSHQAVSNDPYFINGSLWGMYGDASSPANQYGSQAAEAWSVGKTGSNTVYVGIIDEGVNFAHPDLDANVWTNPYDAPDGIDNDGNGRIDDIRGWDFNGNNNTVYDGRSDDHGTHVAGTIAAEGNGAGVVGVNWNVTYISAKFLGANGGTTSNAIKAVDYLTDLKTRHGLNIVATNNSWGGGGFSQGLLDAINRGGAANILFVAAAGNSSLNTDVNASYPAAYDSQAILSVAAIDSQGALASFSNYGATTVDIGAPGVGINSTLPDNSYGSYSGTSMAAPHVTGAAALYASTHPGATAASIKTAIMSSATATPSLSGKTVTGGRLNVGALMTDAATVTPSLTISDVSAAEGNGVNTPFTFTVTLSPASSTGVTVNYATSVLGGTAVAGDLGSLPSGTLTFAAGVTSQTITVNVQGDTTYEPNETFFVNLSGASVGAVIGDSQGVGTIQNDDPLPSLSITDVSAAEGNSGNTPFTFTVSLSNASSTAVIVNYATSVLGATADAVDLQSLPSSSVTFAAGVTSQTIVVNVLGDTDVESDETFFVDLTSPTGASITDSQGVGTIVNDDTSAVPLPSLTIGDVTATEGNGGNTQFTFTISLSNASSTAVTVNYATSVLGATAVAGDLSALPSGQLNFAAGETSKTISVNVLGDTTFESDETFFVDLSGVSGAVIGDSQGVGTIVNDDSLPSLSITDVAVAEGNSGNTPFTFTVSLSNASSTAVTVNYATSVLGATAVAGDFGSLPAGLLTFAAGEIIQTITVNVLGDTDVESDETFFVDLSSPTDASIADSTGVGTIVNDDTALVPLPSLTIGDFTATEGNSGSKTFTFVVTLSAISASAVTVNWATANGTASSSGSTKDFTAASGTITIPAGATTGTISVKVMGDKTVEANETFFVNLSSPVGATLADGQGVGTITNDDVSPAIGNNKNSDTSSSLNATDVLFADLEGSLVLEDLDLLKKKAR